MSGYFRDPDFQEKLVVLLCRDRKFLRDCAHLLNSDDFKPRKNEGIEIWTIASTALAFWARYHEPIGGMLRAEMLDHAKKMHFSARQKERLLEIATKVKRGDGLVAVDALLEKVVAYKQERLLGKTIQDVTELQERGLLTKDKWLELCLQGVQEFGKQLHTPVEFLPKLEERIARRHLASHRRFPFLMIDPVDEKIQIIPRGGLGVWFGPWKSGKSLALIQTAEGYLVQGYNVLYITLEDPADDVGDRFDASIAGLPVKRLRDLPNKLRKRYVRFTRLLRTKLKIIDGTEEGMSVARIREIWEHQRNSGFTADVVIIDYDDEIVPPRKQKDRRFEFADIYRELRRFAGEKKIFVWTGAQTGRKSEGKKIMSAKELAEDISKVRKATIALGIGQGEWGEGENYKYIYVAGHKFDRQHFGVNIIADTDRSMFYDREATVLREAAEREKHRRKKDDDDE